MPIVIDELSTEILPDHNPGTDGQVRPAEDMPAEQTLDLLELAREREARLAVD